MLSNASNSSATEEIIKIGTYKLKNDEYFKVRKHESQILLQKSFCLLCLLESSTLYKLLKEGLCKDKHFTRVKEQATKKDIRMWFARQLW
jgi:hypothetical protein